MRVCVALILLAGCGCSSSAPLPDPIDVKLFEDLSVKLLDSGEDLSDMVTVNRNNGRFVELRMIPISPLPSEFEGRTVQPFGYWPMAMLLIPSGKERSDSQLVMLMFNWYADTPVSPPTGPDFELASGGSSIFWSENGYSGQPEPGGKLRHREFARWTYLSVPRKNSIKEFDYELVVWPCYEQKRFSEVTFGPPVVLGRGKVKVQE